VRLEQCNICLSQKRRKKTDVPPAVQIIYELSVGHERLEVSDSVLFNSGGSAFMRCPLPPPEHALTAALSKLPKP